MNLFWGATPGSLHDLHALCTGINPSELRQGVCVGGPQELSAGGLHAVQVPSLLSFLSSPEGFLFEKFYLPNNFD